MTLFPYVLVESDYDTANRFIKDVYEKFLDAADRICNEPRDDDDFLEIAVAYACLNVAAQAMHTATGINPRVFAEQFHKALKEELRRVR